MIKLTPSSLFAVVPLVAACASSPPSDPAGSRESAHASEQHDHAGAHAHGHDHGHHDHTSPHGMPHRFEDPEAWAARFDAPERDAWQEPDRVIAALNLRGDEVVADVGAGTGYFTVRFARALPKGRVVGVDVEPTMVAYLEARAAKASLDNVSGLLAEIDDASLAAIGAPVDVVFLCNTYHHIADREAYFRAVGDHVAEGGRLVIVDFRLDSRRGPPAEHKIGPERVLEELAAAGWREHARHDFLSDQYVLEFVR